MPYCTPPWERMPLYITSFQSSPVKICRQMRRMFYINDHVAHIRCKNVYLKVIIMCADQKVAHSWFCSKSDGDCSHFTCVIFMCAYVCIDVWDGSRDEGCRASEQSCLICAWGEKYPRVQCVMESRQHAGICRSQT